MSLRKCICMAWVICGTLKSGQAHAQRTVAEQYFAWTVNEERAAAGLPGLAWNGPLAAVALQHAERMAAADTMSHQLQGEPDLSERVAATGTSFAVLAENVGVGPSPAELHLALMHSPHHRDNILDPKVNSVGMAVVFAHGSLWVVQDFALDLPSLPLERRSCRWPACCTRPAWRALSQHRKRGRCAACRTALWGRGRRLPCATGPTRSTACRTSCWRVCRGVE